MPIDSRHLPKRFGKTVRELRLAAELTQMEFAEKADLSLNYVGEIERGEKMASLETIIRLSAGLDITGAELLAKAKL